MRLTTRRKIVACPRPVSRRWCRPAAFAPSRSRCWGKLRNEKLPYLLLTGESLRTVERQVLAHVGDRSRPRHALSHVRGAVGNILAPHRKACQCSFPILPQCDSFLIIVFPVGRTGLFGHMSIEWRILKKCCIATLDSHERVMRHISDWPGTAPSRRLPAVQQKRAGGRMTNFPIQDARSDPAGTAAP